MGRLLRRFGVRVSLAAAAGAAGYAAYSWRRVIPEPVLEGDLALPGAPATSDPTATGLAKPTLKPIAAPAFPPRAERLAALEERRFDVVVVGGGAIGLYTALDAATRGLSVCLVEAHDFGAGSSTQTPKFVQSGFHDCQRALRRRDPYILPVLQERQLELQTLRSTAPRLVEPIRTVIPVFRALEAFETGLCSIVAAATQFYRFGPSRSARPRFWSASTMAELYPDMVIRPDEGGLAGAVVTSDLIVDDARLAVELAKTASRAGAVVVNHATVVGCDTQRVARSSSLVLTQRDRNYYASKMAYDAWRDGKTKKDAAGATATASEAATDAIEALQRALEKKDFDLENNVDRFDAAIVRDELTGKQYRVEGRVLINCAGRWIDSVRRMVRPDASDALFQAWSSHLSFVMPPVRPAVESSPRAIPGERHALVVGGSHINSQRMFVMPHPALGPEAVIVGGADSTHTEPPGENRDRGVEPQRSARFSDLAFVLDGLSMYGVMPHAFPTAVLSPTTSLFHTPSHHPNTIPNAMRYETNVELTHAQAHMLTPLGGAWADARLLAERTVSIAWREVLFRQGFVAEQKAPPPPPCHTARICVAPGAPPALEPASTGGVEVGQPETARSRRARRLGDVAAAAVDALEAARADLREPLVAGLPRVTRAEALHSLRSEGAETTLDAMRRASLIDEGAVACARGLRDAVGWLGKELGWDAARRRFEVETALPYIEAAVPQVA